MKTQLVCALAAALLFPARSFAAGPSPAPQKLSGPRAGATPAEPGAVTDKKSEEPPVTVKVKQGKKVIDEHGDEYRVTEAHEVTSPPPPPLGVVAPPPPPQAPAVDRLEYGRAASGGAGLDRVRAATILPQSLAMTVGGGFFRTKALTADSGLDTWKSSAFGVSFAPNDAVELSGAIRSVTLTNPDSDVQNAWLVNDVLLRAKVGSVVSDRALALALEASLRVPPLGSAPLNQSGLSPQVGVLATYDLRHEGAPLRFHLNTGVLFDNSVDLDDEQQSRTRRMALGITTFNQWQLGLGMEARFKIADVVGFVPFVEYALDAPLGAPGGIAKAPQRITPGIRLLPWRGLMLDAVCELGLSRGKVPGVPDAPPYLLMASLGYMVDWAR